MDKNSSILGTESLQKLALKTKKTMFKLMISLLLYCDVTYLKIFDKLPANILLLLFLLSFFMYRKIFGKFQIFRKKT